MKILLVIPNLKKGGAERLVIDILKQLLLEKNIDAQLVIFRDEIEYQVEDIKEFIKIIPSSVSLSFKRKPILRIDDLQKFIEYFKPDIIHTHLFEAEIVSRFCTYPKARWFSHVHDNMPQLKNLSFNSISNKQAITNYFEKKILFKNYKKNGGTHFVAISKHTEFYTKSVQSKYAVSLIHNAINVQRFQKTKDYKQPYTHSADKQITPNSTLLTLINIGSFVPKKNQNFLLDIIFELKERKFNVNCIFLGEGPTKQEVEMRATDLTVINNCQFLGNVEQVEEYLWKSDVYVHTAIYEPLGLVLIEAMAAGLPIVTLDGHGNRDLMENGKNGFILSYQDPKKFADKIIEVNKNEEMKLFNIHFAQHYDIGNYTSKLLGIYNS
ncbi:MAG: glycosyltransferase [Crocinitomicaceae bacterium]|nr:glycosyltransferase [Crocinitomicaceae bacterium]MCF8409953.1 glycosyltransferase [Crocinitomicaceae bacterium]MCF8444649.1 glycosyltransferase [Crocinitomicaceae bacterium]